MPEAPEVESMARQLHRRAAGSCIKTVSVTDGRVLRHPTVVEFSRRLESRTIRRVERRGKAVCLMLDQNSLVILPRMTGRFEVIHGSERSALRPYEKWRLVLSNGDTIVYNDTRCLGDVRLVPDPNDCAYVARLGPDMLQRPEVPNEVIAAASRSVRPIKAWLMDAAHVAGVGNIYASEILFRCGIHPCVPASHLTVSDWKRLWSCGHDVLRRALACGGTTIRDHRTPDGATGSFKQHLAVYGRHQKPCVVCGATIQKIILSGRSTYFCPQCQSEHGRGRQERSFDRRCEVRSAVVRAVRDPRGSSLQKRLFE